MVLLDFVHSGSSSPPPLNRAMFDPAAEFSPKELKGLADEGVRVFLAAFGAALTHASRSPFGGALVSEPPGTSPGGCDLPDVAAGIPEADSAHAHGRSVADTGVAERRHRRTPGPHVQTNRTQSGRGASKAPRWSSTSPLIEIVPLKQRAQGTRVVSETIRLVIADDHPVVRDGLRAMLDTQPNIEVVGEAGTGAEALSLVRSLRPDLVLMDLQMPELDGASATRRIKAEHKDVQVLVLITYDTDADISRAVEAGATGYLLKDARREEVFNAVRLAARGESVLSPGGGLARAGEDARPRRRVAEHP